ncbi:40874_t:CDS:1, partial [Gigaspora margarita]
GIFWPIKKRYGVSAIAPNYIVELRSFNDSSQSVHNKLLKWMEAGVEES